MRPFTLMSLALALALTTQPAAQQAPALDGPAHPFQDALVAQLAGDWTMPGTLLGKPVTYTLHADWVLSHQFLRLEMRDTSDPPAYEATGYIGYDNMSERYVAHWMDVFGGRMSLTLGYGHREGDAVRFVFEYPDGPFHATYALDAGGKTWTVVMRQRQVSGAWQDFARYQLRRR